MDLASAAEKRYAKAIEKAKKAIDAKVAQSKPTDLEVGTMFDGQDLNILVLNALKKHYLLAGWYQFSYQYQERNNRSYVYLHRDPKAFPSKL